MGLGLWLFPGHESQKPAATTAPPRLGLTLVLVILVLTGVGLAVWGLGRLNPDLGGWSNLPQGRDGKLRGGFVMIPILQWDVVNRCTGSPSSNFWTASS